MIPGLSTGEEPGILQYSEDEALGLKTCAEGISWLDFPIALLSETVFVTSYNDKFLESGRDMSTRLDIVFPFSTTCDTVLST